MLYHWVRVPDANPPVTGADTNVYRESDHVESLQTPCRSAYGVRTVQCIVH